MSPPPDFSSSQASPLLPTWHQDQSRLLRVQSALPHLSLVAERAVLREALDEPYELVLECLSASATLALETLIGEQLSLHVRQADAGGRGAAAYQACHGYVAEAAHLASDGGLARYRLVLRPWLHWLGQRRNNRIFQGQSTRQIVDTVLAQYPVAQWRWAAQDSLPVRPLCIQWQETDLAFVQRLLAEDGLSSCWEHLSGDDADAADKRHQARHRLVLADPHTELADFGGDLDLLKGGLGGPLRFTADVVDAHNPLAAETVSHFEAERRLSARRVRLTRWNERQLVADHAEASSALDLGRQPWLEHHDGGDAQTHADDVSGRPDGQASTWLQRQALQRLQALEQRAKHYAGSSGVRRLRPGAVFSLIDHALYGPGRRDNRFVLLAVEHHYTNNLGSQAAQVLGSTTLERGSYVNHFRCTGASAGQPNPLRPTRRTPPVAPHLLSARIVGLADAAVTSDREHRVKVQFAFQRGEHALSGGLPGQAAMHGGDDRLDANALGDERNGIWLRLASPAAGANWGSVHVPRIGSEVAVQFLNGDLNRPLISGCLYNDADLPPLAAGQDSGVNHPGVLGGWVSQGLDGQGSAQWTVDDAPGQLRMRLGVYPVDGLWSELQLGHLIGQAPGSAQRGAWRGQGFEAATGGWASVRAAQGLLLSACAQSGSYGSAQGHALHAHSAQSQLHGAQQLAQRLSDAAQSVQAHGLPQSSAAGQAVDQLNAALDPARDGRYPAQVNGQAAHAGDGHTPSEASLPSLGAALIAVESPSTLAQISDASIGQYSAQALSLAAQGDVHVSSGHTYAQVSGQGSTWHTHHGGAQLKAAQGPVSLRAHTDALAILADQAITLSSVNDEVRIEAKERIRLVAGQSGITLEGGNITIITPGALAVKGASKAWPGGERGEAGLPHLPDQRLGQLPNWIEISHQDAQDQAFAGQRYKILFEGGSVVSGTLNAQGQAHHDNVPPKALRVEYEPREPEPQSPWEPLSQLTGAAQRTFKG